MNIRRRLIRFAHYIYLAVLAGLSTGFVQAGDFDRGLLWKIEVDGAAPSYLFGTLHAEDERVVNLPAPVQQAFENSRRVTLEMTMDPATLINASLSTLLTDGRKLADIVGESDYRRAVAALADYGIPDVVVMQMKPWAVATTLVMPKPETGVVLDVLLYQRALAAGKQVTGLETLDEQIAVFDNMSDKQQIAMLRDTLDSLPQVHVYYEEMLAAWLDRDLARLVEIAERSMEGTDPAMAEQFNQSLILDRNRRMAERLRARLVAGNEFIAVGALHLPGENGLLRLLQAQGCRVTPVY